VSGTPIFGHKTFTGSVHFGYEPLVEGNPPNNFLNSPQNYTVNSKYQNANGINSPTISQKFASLGAADMVTKLILQEQLQDYEIDNGFYHSVEEPGCNNYSINGSSLSVCPA
jgi:hypothetical protein